MVWQGCLPDHNSWRLLEVVRATSDTKIEEFLEIVILRLLSDRRHIVDRELWVFQNCPQDDFL